VSGETEQNISGWTVDTLHELNRVIRDYEERFQIERDRRYSEVNIEREKALKIKETADLAALSLAREIQDYKDEKANNLREQITGERGQYATKDDLIALGKEFTATLEPIKAYVTSQQGRHGGFEAGWGYLVAVSGVFIAIAAVVVAVVTK
jgi:hypothetical protein